MNASAATLKIMRLRMSWLAIIAITACGAPSGKEYKKATNSSDSKANLALKVTVPDITVLATEVADAATKTTGMSIDVAPAAATCKTTAFHQVKAYSKGDVSVPVGTDCDVNVSVAVGELSKTTLALSADAPTYNEDIKALVTTSCGGCHGANSSNGDLSTYETLKNLASDSLERIQTTDKSKLMPPSTALAADKQALFKAWVDGGLVEKAGTAAPAASLVKVYFKNNESKKVVRSELKGSEVTISVALDLQADGTAAGFKTKVLGEDTVPTASGSGSGDSQSGTPQSGSTPAPTPTPKPADKPAPAPTPTKVAYADVKPILDAKCANCHKAGTNRVDLSKYTDATTLKNASTKNNGFTTNMPQGSTKLTADELAKLKEWEKQGFPAN